MIKKKILILGNKGMTGHILEKYLNKTKEYVVGGLNRSHVDMNNYCELAEIISNTNPDIIINCVGILKPTNNFKEFGTINSALPQILANLIKERNPHMKLIHLSTNCVFSNIGPHKAEETPNANDSYGLSKAFGEMNDDHNLTIRTSMTGPELKEEGINLFNWFVKKSPEEVTGYTNALWNGVTTLELAKFIEHCIKEDIKGLVNFYTKGEINKFGLLKIINEVYNLGKKIISTEREGVHSALLTGPYFIDKSYEEQFKELKEWY